MTYLCFQVFGASFGNPIMWGCFLMLISMMVLLAILRGETSVQNMGRGKRWISSRIFVDRVTLNPMISPSSASRQGQVCMGKTPCPHPCLACLWCLLCLVSVITGQRLFINCCCNFSIAFFARFHSSHCCWWTQGSWNYTLGSKLQLECIWAKTVSLLSTVWEKLHSFL